MIVRHGARVWVAALAGATLLLSAADARAAFTIRDVEGIWLYCAFSDDTDDNGPGWSRGRFIADAGGSVTGGEQVDSGGGARIITGGSLSIDADGFVSGTVEFVGGGSFSLTDFKMDPGKTMLVGLTSEGTSRVIVLVVKAGGSFEDGDREGLWYYHTYWDNVSENDPGWTRGHFVVDDAGEITGGEQTNNEGEDATVLGGSIEIDEEGVVSGSMQIQKDGEDEEQLIGFSDMKMDSGKNVIGGVRSDESGDPVIIVVVKGGGSFATEDLEGTWTLREFGDEWPDNNPHWTSGRIDVDASGTVTGDSVEGDDEGSGEIDGISLSIDEEGFVSGSIRIVGDGTSSFTDFKMDPEGRLIVGVDSELGDDPSLTVLVPEPRQWMLQLIGIGCVLVPAILRNPMGGSRLRASPGQMN